jgi:hypothetical protein
MHCLLGLVGRFPVGYTAHRRVLQNGRSTAAPSDAIGVPPRKANVTGLPFDEVIHRHHHQ